MILAEQTESKALARSSCRCATTSKRGTAISDSFAKHSESFPPIMINMVRAGETGGFLDAPSSR